MRSSFIRSAPVIVTMALAVSAALAQSMAPSRPAASPSTMPSTSSTMKAKVDLNTASEQEIAAIPGIGPETAKKIVSGRPYTTVDDLAKAGVPSTTISQIRSNVVVSGQGTTTNPGGGMTGTMGTEGTTGSGSGVAGTGTGYGSTGTSTGTSTSAGSRYGTTGGATTGSSTSGTGTYGASTEGNGPAGAATNPASRSGSVSGTTYPAGESDRNVWVNTSTKKYYFEGETQYGKSTHGKYMTESEAKAAGYHAGMKTHSATHHKSSTTTNPNPTNP